MFDGVLVVDGNVLVLDAYHFFCCHIVFHRFFMMGALLI